MKELNWITEPTCEGWWLVGPNPKHGMAVPLRSYTAYYMERGTKGEWRRWSGGAEYNPGPSKDQWFAQLEPVEAAEQPQTKDPRVVCERCAKVTPLDGSRCLGEAIHRIMVVDPPPTEQPMTFDPKTGTRSN